MHITIKYESLRIFEFNYTIAILVQIFENRHNTSIPRTIYVGQYEERNKIEAFFNYLFCKLRLIG